MYVYLSLKTNNYKETVHKSYNEGYEIYDIQNALSCQR